MAKKIIIIDDDFNIRDVLSKILTSKGYLTLTSADALNGIQLIKNNLPDIVILDYKLPYAMGDNVLRKIKEISHTIKVIVLSGYDEIPPESFLEMGAEMFISKSQGITTIVNKILEMDKKTDIKEITEKQNVKKQTIMVVEDDEYIRTFLLKFLRSKGYEVITASNGKEAIDRLKSSKVLIILLDIFMPEMDGREFMKLLDRMNEKPYVIVISGNEDEEIAKELLRDGAVDYIKKPIDLQRLETLIKTFSFLSS